jgi:hypothetical protein
MSFGEFLALAVVVGGICAIFAMMTEAYKAKMRVKERELELRLANQNSAEPATQLPTSERFEERLRVLERIATDRKQSLADEIDALRGERSLVE